MSSRLRKPVAVAVTMQMLWLPLAGCSRSPDVENKGEAQATGKDDAGWAQRMVAVASQSAADAWDYTTDKAGATFVVVRKHTQNATEIATDRADAVWVWSKDKTADGWSWIEEHGSRAARWAGAQADGAWMVTRDQAGQFSLWVKVEVDEGVAWAKTTLPAAWNVSKDSAGKSWVWIDEHKVEIGVAATVVTVVVLGLLTAPEAVAVAAISAGKGVAAAGGASGARFLVDLYQKHRGELGGVSQEQFTTIGKSVVREEGDRIMSFRKRLDSD